MPERVLSARARARLSAALDRGAPLVAPLASQARYATMRGPMPSPRWRVRALTIAVAAVGIVAVAFAGPTQPRDWVVQSVNDISKQVGIPAGSVTPSPSEKSSASGAKEPTGAGQPQVTHKATVEPSESPEAEGTQASGPAQPQPSPTSGDGGDDRSPEPSPSN
ncbi:MAG TPA: hypothetical protein VGV88_11940 [Candidatus Dormibacteraeota bacterium]|nr:hypothetical protein [Candidatus Dormibacteraeota bacterium]